MVCHSERSNVVAKSKNLVLILFTVCAMALSLTACGDDDSSFSPRADDDSSIETSSSVATSSSERSEGDPSSSNTDDKSSNSAKSSSSVNSSSSSVASSSSERSSSSGLGCKTEIEDNCEYGELVDERDGQTYKTVKIGDQEWMAENLNYAYLQPTKILDSSSFCYNDSAGYCEKYGRFYTWAAAMDSAGIWNSNGKGCGNGDTCSVASKDSATLVRGVCPEGWHLPTRKEWNSLCIAVGGGPIAATKLKSTFGWSNNGNGADDFSFSALPAGIRYNVNYEGMGNRVHFWSSTEYDRISAYDMTMSYGIDYAFLDDRDKGYGLNVRCLKD